MDQNRNSELVLHIYNQLTFFFTMVLKQFSDKINLFNNDAGTIKCVCMLSHLVMSDPL